MKDTYFANWSEKCRKELLTNIMPFWMKHGWDRRNGGVHTCVDRDGTVEQPAKGNIFKGPFHIPRMLVKMMELGKEIGA